MTVPRNQRSATLLDRALARIPDASQTASKAPWAFPGGDTPYFLSEGRGGRVWDIDGNAYVDLMLALLPVLLGYRDPDVDRAIRDQLDHGILFSLNHPLEVELAELLADIVPCAEQVRFAKSGSDVTTAAVRLARGVTGRDHVACCGYHGWHDWSIAGSTRPDGVPEAVRNLSHSFPYNDLAALQALLDSHPDGFAAVVIEPTRWAEPAAGFLEGVRDAAQGHGALLIFDEVVTGFRLAPGGAQALYGVTPDLAAFGKGMANGMPISALAGRAEVMQHLDRVFFSGTFGGETLSLAAARATLKKVIENDVCGHLQDLGRRLSSGVAAAIGRHGLDTVIVQGGPPAMRHLTFHSTPDASALAARTVLMREMLSHGVLLTSFHGLCYAHTEADVDLVITAYDAALSALAEEIGRGDLDNRLGSDVIRPVFPPRGG